jgi:hypothetical protein
MNQLNYLVINKEDGKYFEKFPVKYECQGKLIFEFPDLDTELLTIKVSESDFVSGNFVSGEEILEKVAEDKEFMKKYYEVEDNEFMETKLDERGVVKKNKKTIEDEKEFFRSVAFRTEFIPDNEYPFRYTKDKYSLEKFSSFHVSGNVDPQEFLKYLNTKFEVHENVEVQHLPERYKVTGCNFNNEMCSFVAQLYFNDEENKDQYPYIVEFKRTTHGTVPFNTLLWEVVKIIRNEDEYKLEPVFKIF